MFKKIALLLKCRKLNQKYQTIFERELTYNYTDTNEEKKAKVFFLINGKGHRKFYLTNSDFKEHVYITNYVKPWKNNITDIPLYYTNYYIFAGKIREKTINIGQEEIDPFDI